MFKSREPKIHGEPGDIVVAEVSGPRRLLLHLQDRSPVIAVRVVWGLRPENVRAVASQLVAEYGRGVRIRQTTVPVAIREGLIKP